MRLSEGTEGRVEILHSGKWGTVCADAGFDKAAAIVVCRQLGLPGGTVVTKGSYGRGPGKTWLANMMCSSGEAKLDQCGYDGWEKVKCYKGDAAVRCDKGSHF